MQTLWALALMLAIQGGALDLLPAPPLDSLPAAGAQLNSVNVVPLNLPGSQGRRPSTQQGSPPRKRPVGSTGGRCTPAAKYLLSSSKIKEYLMGTLPPQIEELVKCDDVNLAGLIGKALDTVGETDLLSMLDVSALLDLGGGGLGLDGLLGKGGDGKSPKLPSLSKATGLVSDTLPGVQEGLGSLIPPGLKKGPVKELLDGNGLSDLQEPLDKVVKEVGDLKGSAQDMVKNVLPVDIKKDVSDMLDMDINKLLLELTVDKVTVDNMELTMEDNGIQVHAETSATIGGKGALGAVIELVAFETKLDVIMKIDISSNNTQCVDLEVLETHVEVTDVAITLVETVTGTVPLPVPLPLNKIVPVVLSVEMNEKLQKSNSCAIVLSDFNNCKNSTGLFKYQEKSAKISDKGLSILYCVDAIFGKKTVPVPGSRLPPDSKNANISMSLSRSLIKTLLTQAAQQSSVNMDNLAANVTKVSYMYQKDKRLRATYQVTIRKDGENFATGKTNLILSHESKIVKDKLVAIIKVIRSDQTVDPPESKEEVGGIMSEVAKKLFSSFNELLKEMNVPTGISSFPLTDAKVNTLKSNDLQASS